MDPFHTIINNIRSNAEHTDLKTKLSDQVVAREDTNVNVIDVSITANFHSPPKDDSTTELDLAKEYNNSTIIEAVDKLTITGYVRKLTLSNVGILNANKMFGKKMISKKTAERTNFTKLNTHTDIISMKSLIKIYQNTSKKRIFRATPKDSQDPLFIKPRSIDDLIPNLSIINSYSKQLITL